MNFKEIQEIIKLIQKSNLTEFKLKDGEFELSIRTEKYQSGKTTQFVAPSTQPMLHMQPAAAPVSTPAQAASPASSPAKEPQATLASESSDDSSEYLPVRSPMVGTFYRSPSPDKGPYIKVGDVIEKGDVVCIVEAMKLFNEIESEHGGRIVKVMIEDAQPVEYDQVLFLIDPKG
ncbi:MAG: acetyl-CoA carboxylase biotin carboxyl carrier protein [Saprospirales bacterium]|nr:acetyl-CoA carboxylase biotin carboxyl carrier protein [Saprospirales bacterium]MBK8489639.1 acetyl-CoA carboxylase biotin carboxyl carrier protein [Saprospirales bacterium]